VEKYIDIYSKPEDTELIRTVVIDVSGKVKLEREKSELEMQLKNQQKLESIGTLASGVAHEINNPINGILNYGQIISDSSEEDSQIKKVAKEIINETNRVAKIVKDLLDFSRQTHKEVDYANIEELVNQTISLVNTIFRHDQIILNVDIQENLPNLKCNGQQIQQVIMNLLTNARDSLNEKYPGYSPNKVINVTCKKEEKDNEKWLQIIVEDLGKGVPEKILPKIFDPFFTTKGRSYGTGLGLSISYGIIKDHNGVISIETEHGEYARFCIKLPY
jgi:signal transduction histidine kinase